MINSTLSLSHSHLLLNYIVYVLEFLLRYLSSLTEPPTKNYLRIFFIVLLLYYKKKTAAAGSFGKKTDCECDLT